MCFWHRDYYHHCWDVTWEGLVDCQLFEDTGYCRYRNLGRDEHGRVYPLSFENDGPFIQDEPRVDNCPNPDHAPPHARVQQVGNPNIPFPPSDDSYDHQESRSQEKGKGKAKSKSKSHKQSHDHHRKHDGGGHSKKGGGGGGESSRGTRV